MTSQFLRLVVRPEEDVDRLVDGMASYARALHGDARRRRCRSSRPLDAHRSRRPVSHARGGALMSGPRCVASPAPIPRHRRPRRLAVQDLLGVAADGAAAREPAWPRPGRRAAETLPDRPDRVGAFGVGFLVVHLADDHLLAQVNWWVRPDELHQRAFVSPPGDAARCSWSRRPRRRSAASANSTIAAHEGGAWMRHVIANPAGPDIDGLSRRRVRPTGVGVQLIRP